MYKDKDTIKLLKAIKKEMTGFIETKYVPHSIHKMTTDFHSMRQGRYQSNQQWYDQFTTFVETAEEAGVSLADHSAGTRQVLREQGKDPDQARAMANWSPDAWHEGCPLGQGHDTN